MRVIQAMRLGHQSLVGHRRRSISVIVTMGILFGVLLGILFVVQGLENIVLGAANGATGGKYYLQFTTNQNICRTDYGESDDPYDRVTKCMEQDWMESIPSMVEPYGGKVIAADSTLVTPANVTNFLRYDLDKVPADSVPILVDFGTALRAKGITAQGKQNYLKDAVLVNQITSHLIGTTYYDHIYKTNVTIVGILPEEKFSNLAIKKYANEVSLNPLDFMLSMLPGAGANALLVDNDSANVKQFALVDNWVPVTFEGFHMRLVEFNSLDGIWKFYADQDCLSHQKEFCQTVYVASGDVELPNQRPYTFSEIYTNAVQDKYWFNFFKTMLGVVEIIIIGVALLVTILTCIKVVDAELVNIRLYRQIGASAKDVCLIYLSYLLEMCLLAVGFALALGVIIGIFFTSANGGSLAQMLTAAYSTPYTGSTLLLGFGFNTLRICLIMLLPAPLCLGICANKLIRTY